MRRRNQGITLIEILVVVAIVGTLSSLLYFVIAPRAKRGAIETRIRSDLHQITAAIAVYRADYDDGYPPDLEALPAGTPIRIPNWPERSEFCPGCGIADARYTYWYSQRQRLLTVYYPVGVAFDETKNAIVDAQFYKIDPVQEYRLPQAVEGGGFRQMRVSLRRVLGAKTDGSVYWKPEVDLWQWRIMEFGLSPIPPRKTKER